MKRKNRVLLVAVGGLCFFTTMKAFAQVEAVAMDQQWVGNVTPGTAGAGLQIAKNPDGSESADLMIKNRGCVGGVNGLVTRKGMTLTITADVKQGNSSCRITFTQIGKSLVRTSATSECSSMGGVGCEPDFGEMTLHRIADIPDSSSNAGLYYYTHHHK